MGDNIRDKKNWYMALTEKPQKYQDHCMEELINMNILQAKEILPSD